MLTQKYSMVFVQERQTKLRNRNIGKLSDQYKEFKTALNVGFDYEI